MSVIPPSSLLLGADQLMDPACHRHTFDTLTDPMWTHRLNLALFLDATKHFCCAVVDTLIVYYVTLATPPFPTSD